MQESELYSLTAINRHYNSIYVELELSRHCCVTREWQLQIPTWPHQPCRTVWMHGCCYHMTTASCILYKEALKMLIQGKREEKMLGTVFRRGTRHYTCKLKQDLTCNSTPPHGCANARPIAVSSTSSWLLVMAHSCVRWHQKGTWLRHITQPLGERNNFCTLSFGTRIEGN